MPSTTIFRTGNTASLLVFSADTPHQAHIVKTPAELKRTLAQVHHAEELCLIELQLPRMDAPQLLKQFAEVVARYDYGEYGYKQLVEQNTPPYKRQSSKM